MKLTKTTCVSPCAYCFFLQADGAEFDAAIEAVYQSEKATFSLPGYPKGNAPRAAIEAKAGRGVFYFNAINQLLVKEGEPLLTEALAAQDLTPITAPDYDIAHCDQDGFCITITIGTLPPLTLGQYTGLQMEYPLMQADEAIIDNQLEYLRTQIASDTGEHAANISIDDAFAQRYTSSASLAQLRSDMELSFAEYFAKNAFRKAKFALLEQIGQSSTVTLPTYLLEREYELAMEKLTDELEAAEIPFDAYLKQQGLTKQGLERVFRENAANALRAKLTAYTIAKKEGITVSDAEVACEQVRLSVLEKQTVPEFQEAYPAFLVKNDLILSHTLDFLVQHCTLTPKQG